MRAAEIPAVSEIQSIVLDVDQNSLTAIEAAIEKVREKATDIRTEAGQASFDKALAQLERMAKLAPELIARLVYVTCSAPLPGVSFRGQMGEGLQGANPDEVGWPVLPATHSADECYRLMFCNDMSHVEATAFLAKMGGDVWPMDPLTCTDHGYDHLAAAPSTYIVCVQDAGLPPEWQRRFAKRLHCERVVELEAGHQAMVTKPERLVEMLLAEHPPL